MEEFHVNSTEAILPLSLYVFALALGPILGGPLSETVGRYPIYLASTPLGAMFTLAAGCATNFTALCILRFLAAFAFSPSLAIASSVVAELYLPEDRGLPSVFCILMPFIGPGMGYVNCSHFFWQLY
jgi:MFS family permease